MKRYNYYLCKPTSSYNTRSKSIDRYSPTEYVSINQYVDLPYVSVGLDLMNQRLYSKPQSSDYEKYLPIKKEDFYNYLTVSMDVFKSIRLTSNAEVYAYEPYAGCVEITLFNNVEDNKTKHRVELRVYRNIEDADVEISYSRSYKAHSKLRQKGKNLDRDTFEYLLRETIAFIEDDYNYLDNFQDFSNLFFQTYAGEIEPVLKGKQVDLSWVKLSLESQIKEIESRLMNSDSDKKPTRERLRGRIEGIRSAINQINKHERQSDNL